MKILLLIAVWKRIDITEKVYKHLKKILPDYVEVLIVGSEPEHKQLAKKYSFKYCEHENILGAKLNYGLSVAMKSEWDYILQIGSDDIIHEDVFELYQNQTGDIFGFDRCYMTNGTETKLFDYKGEAILGAGRMISRRAIENTAACIRVKPLTQLTNKDLSYPKNRVVSVPKNIALSWIESGHAIKSDQKDDILLWNPTAMRGMDSYSQKILSAHGFEFNVIHTERVLVCDIKSEVNIFSYEEIQGESVELPTYFAKAIK